MEINRDIRAAEIARGLFIKRKNAVAAVSTGVLLSLWAARFLEPSSVPVGSIMLWWIVGGFLCGIFYANAFEYVLHRFVLHWGHNFLVRQHASHHDSVGRENEARYVNFASSSWVVVLLFVSNAVPAFFLLFLLERYRPFFPAGIFGVGIVGGFTLYYVLYEEIHWRMHMGGWLPLWLAFARRHHMLHHGDFPGRYNVFLPLCDWIVGLFGRKHEAPVPPPVPPPIPQ